MNKGFFAALTKRAVLAPALPLRIATDLRVHMVLEGLSAGTGHDRQHPNRS
jgi:hypothetical protein